MAELEIVHLDESLAVVDKPAGLVVHPAPSHTGPTLVDELGDVLGGGGDPERPGIVHRLDKGTSGAPAPPARPKATPRLWERVRPSGPSTSTSSPDTSCASIAALATWSAAMTKAPRAPARHQARAGALTRRSG